jgi:[ribosomal protein S18]-alanine N-acetyltransferase
MKGDNIQIKPPQIDCLPAMMALDRLCLNALWSEDTYRREFNSENCHFVAAIDDRDPLNTIGFGCFWAILDEAHIILLAVHPDYRRQGLGRRLLVAMLDRAREINMVRATLEVRTSNQPAIDLYTQLGFKIAGTRHKYYQNPIEDALVMWLDSVSLQRRSDLEIRDLRYQPD